MLSKSLNNVKRFLKDESGMETLEFAVIAAIMGAVVLLVYGSGWGASLRTKLLNAANTGTPAL